MLVNFPLQTAVAALHLYLGMETPGKEESEEKVLIWGAGGAVGSYAVQYAKSVSTAVGSASEKLFNIYPGWLYSNRHCVCERLRTSGPVRRIGYGRL